VRGKGQRLDEDGCPIHTENAGHGDIPKAEPAMSQRGGALYGWVEHRRATPNPSGCRARGQQPAWLRTPPEIQTTGRRR